MLFRLIGLDLVRDLNLDAYKVQLIEICSYLPENIDKKLYQD
jgi:hypothetical protein